MEGFTLYHGLLLLFALFIFFLPSIVGRKKESFWFIFAMNLLLGWSAIGWAVALLWAMFGRRRVYKVS